MCLRVLGNTGDVRGVETVLKLDEDGMVGGTYHSEEGVHDVALREEGYKVHQDERPENGIR